MKVRNLAVLVLISGLATPTALAQQSLTNVGTLTCTTGETLREGTADAALSCSFKGQSGLEGDFAGRIARSGPAQSTLGKRVLVWSVLSSKPKIDLDSLQGTYKGMTGGAQPNSLIGGTDGSIELQPMTATAEEGTGLAPAEMELRIRPTKA